MFTGTEEKPTQTGIDIQTALTGIVVPILVGIMATQVDLRRAIALIVFALLLSVVALREAVIRWVKGTLRNIREKRFARRKYPQLVALVNEFEAFVGSDRSNTIHDVLRNLLRGQIREVAPEIVDQHLFVNWWHMLARRTKGSRPDADGLVDGLDDLETLLNAFIRGCWHPIFEESSDDFVESLDRRGIAELESARERFASYLDRVSSAAQEIGRSITSRPGSGRYLKPPRPLIPGKGPGKEKSE